MSSQLFIELYLDEDVDVLVAKLLRARGFVAVTTQEAGLLGSTEEQFHVAGVVDSGFWGVVDRFQPLTEALRH